MLGVLPNTVKIPANNYKNVGGCKMKKLMEMFVIGVVVVLLVPGTYGAWNLHDDYSYGVDPTPNGWSYWDGAGTTQWTDWIQFDPGGFQLGEYAWGNASGLNYMAICYVTQADPEWDAQPGDILSHAQATIRWTAPEAGTYSVSGSAYRIRDNDGVFIDVVYERGDTGEDIKFSQELGRTGGPLTGDPGVDRNNPLLYSFDVTMAAGETLDLLIHGNDFCAVTMDIVPEPVTLLLLLGGSLPMVFRRGKRS